MTSPERLLGCAPRRSDDDICEEDFLIVAAEQTNAVPVGLQDKDTILENQLTFY